MQLAHTRREKVAILTVSACLSWVGTAMIAQMMVVTVRYLTQ